MNVPFYLIFHFDPRGGIFLLMFYIQGHNEGRQGGRNSPGAESLRKVPNGCGGAEKFRQCHKRFLQYSTFASKKPQSRTWGRQTCFLPRVPSSLATPLSTFEYRFKRWMPK